MQRLFSLSLLLLVLGCKQDQSNPAGKSVTVKGSKGNGNAATKDPDPFNIPGEAIDEEDPVAAPSSPSNGGTKAKPIAGVPTPAMGAGVCTMTLPKAPVLAAPVPHAVIRTVTAGRVRQRHESNGTFAGFGDHYFENRSFEIILEDFTPTGVKKFKITMKPLGIAGTGATLPDGSKDVGLPNLRLFQNGGANPDQFNINLLMNNEGNNVFTYTYTDGGNDPATALTAGRLVGFEFGFFFNPKKVAGRNSYYSDTFRFVVGRPGLVLGVPLTPNVPGDPDAQVERRFYSAGDFTVPNIIAEADRHLAYSQSSLNILQPDMQGFLEGRSLFHSDFTSGTHTEQGITFSAERIAKQKGLAGPAMDANACSVCHSENGRFQAGATDAPVHVLKISTLADAPHPQYGLQLQKSENAASKILLERPTKGVAFEDGTKVTLSYPKYTLKDSKVSARIPLMVYGLGLLEAVAPETILARACDDSAKDISGRAGYAINPETGKKELARFGWKASKVSLKHSVSEALLFDMGVTNPLMPTAECERTGVCGTGTAELPGEDVDRLVKYMQNIAVPVQRNIKDPAFARGQTLFNRLGCASCHVPELYTGNTHPVEKLRNQSFLPYTDLLLHDMGAGLADNRPDGSATGTEWRTPPLWGLGLMKTVNGQMMLLNDGRAKSYEEAILWHGGEAAVIQGEFRKLIKTDRDDLYFFLQSI